MQSKRLGSHRLHRRTPPEQHPTLSPSRTWYPRFGDIPGVDWVCPPSVERAALRGHDARPQDADWDSDWMYWPIVYERDTDRGLSVGIGVKVEGLEDRDDDGGSTSASPARQYPGFTGPRSVAEQLQRLHEALELPGTPSDYHGLLSEAAEYLHKIRRREPAAIAECERLCLLTLDLLRACPEILERERGYSDEDDFPVWVAVTRLLHRMHIDNGDLAEAEQVAVMAEDEFGQRFDRLLNQTRERLAVLRSEDD